MPNTIDIVDKNNQPTGRQSAIDPAMRQGLWHRGVHIVVYTHTGYVLAQKRSSTMLMHPGFLDMSCGGFVDAGETPEQAAVRELREELGLAITPDDLQPLGLRKKNHAWPRLRRHDRTFLYCYALAIPDHHLDLSHLQREEVSWAGFLKLSRARQLIWRHHLKGLGRIEPSYGLYSWLLRAVTDRLHSQSLA